MSDKKILNLFVKRKSESTNKLMAYIAKKIDNINRYYYIKTIYIDASNVKEMMARGIRTVPTLQYGTNVYTNENDIINILTPPENTKDRIHGALTNEEFVHRYQDNLVNTKGDDDDDPSGIKPEQIQKRIAELTSRKKHQIGSDKQSKESMSRKPIKPKTYQSDQDFLKDTHLNEDAPTPTKKHAMAGNADGDAILEDYYLNEARGAGKKEPTKQRRPIRQ